MRGRVFCRKLLQWAPKCSVWSRVTPRSFRRDPADTISPATMTVQLAASFGAWERTRTWVSSLATIIFDELAHRTRAAAACWARLFATSMVLPAHRDAVPSAYMYGVVPGIRLRMSASGANHNRNRVGARTLPCGRPARKIRSHLFQPLSSVWAHRSRRKLQIQEISQSGMLCCSSLTRSRRWSTLSYAMKKSKAVRT